MKTLNPPHRRAFVALVPAALLIAGPGFAQEAATPPPPTVPAPAAPVQTTIAPPPVVPTLPQASAPASPSAAPATAGVARRNGIGDPNSTTPIAPEALEQAEASRAAAATPRTSTRRAAPAPARNTRTVTPAAAPARATAPAAAAAAAPVVTPAAPVAEAPAATAPAPVTVPPGGLPADASAAPAQPATETQTTTAPATETAGGTTLWPWIVGGLVVLGGLLAVFLLRRRRVEDEYYEESYVEPDAPVAATPAPLYEAPVAAAAQSQYQRSEPLAAPIASAPLAAAPLAAVPLARDEPVAVATEDASLVRAEAEDVAALTAGTAPVADRPWLEFAMRPVRAGSNVDEAMVEIELTVGNAGNITAEDVRISTFMFTDGSASEAEMERLLIERGDDGVAPVNIAPGEGTRVDATLAMLKRDLGDHAEFSPVIMADARYRLPDGSEGRTCASFVIGVTDDDGAHIEPISIARPLMREDIAAHLHGTPEHA